MSSMKKLISAFVFAPKIAQSLTLIRDFKSLVIFCCLTARFVSHPVRYDKDRFPHDIAHNIKVRFEGSRLRLQLMC